MFKSFNIFSGSSFSKSQIESQFYTKLKIRPSNELIDFGMALSKEDKSASLNEIISFMVEKELKDYFLLKYNYNVSSLVMKKTLDKFKDSFYTLSIDELASYIIDFDKISYYKNNFNKSFYNKFKRNPNLRETSLAHKKIEEEADNYTPSKSYNDPFPLTLLGLFIAMDLVSEQTKPAISSDYTSDSFLVSSVFPAFSSGTSGESSVESSSCSGSGSGDSSGSGSGTGSGSGSGSGCSGSGSGCGGS